MIAFFELPDGSLVEYQSVVALQPRCNFGDEANGTVILLSSGHTIETDETVERVTEQIAECIARLNA